MPNNPFIGRNRALALRPPAISWNWRVFMPFVSGAPSPIDVVAESVEFSHFNTPANPRFLNAGVNYYPGTAEIPPATIVFYEDEAFTVTRYLYAWKNLYLDTRGNYGMPSNYKKTLTVEMWNINNRIMFRGLLTGCWPTSVSPMGLAYTESGRITVSATFSVDGNMVCF